MSESSESDDVTDSTFAPSSTNTATIFSDVITKIQMLRDKCKTKEQHTNGLLESVTILTELINTVEDHKEDISFENAILVENNFGIFIQTLDTMDIHGILMHDSEFAYRIFYSYFHLFKLSGIKNYFKRDETQNTFVKALIEQFALVILHIITLSVSMSILTIADLQSPFDNCETFTMMLDYLATNITETTGSYSAMTEKVLHFLWNYADKTVVIPNLIKIGYPELVLKWLSMASGRNVIDPLHDFIRLFSPLNSEIQVSQEKSIADATARPLISIIHNMSRHDDGIAVLNSLDGITIVKEVQGWTKDPEINILCCMILALLTTPEQIKNDRRRMNYALDVLLQKVFRASQSPKWKDDGFHISEPLVVLVKLFNDDRALDYILQHAQVPELEKESTVEFFAELLLKFERTVSTEKDPLKQLTCIALVNILWSISFQEQYRSELNENKELMMFLQKFADANNILTSDAEYVPTYIENIQTAAKGIILNVTEQSKKPKAEDQASSSPLNVYRRKSVADALVFQPLPTQKSTASDNTRKPKIMISYSTKDKVLCNKLEEKLKDLFDLWIDKYYCTKGDAWEAIAEGVEEADVVICLITENYDSKSIRREVIYAIDAQEKHTIAVFVKEPNLPKWLRIRTYGLRHVRVSDAERFNDAEISKLIQTIQDHLIAKNNVECTGSHAPLGVSFPTESDLLHTTRPKPEKDNDEKGTSLINTNECSTNEFSQKPVDQWNKTDIRHWFEENKILPELLNMYQFENGSELLEFGKTLFEDEKDQYKSHAATFCTIFNGRTLFSHQFKRFTNALQQIVNDNEQKSKSTKVVTITKVAAASTPVSKSQTCQII